MTKLNPHNQISGTKENLSLILATYSINDFTFSPINEGIENSSFVIESLGKKYVLRVYGQGRATTDTITFEISFQDYLREHGIPIPTIYPNAEGKELTVTEIDGKQWRSILMSFVEGKSTTTELTPELVAELANFQAKMHLLGVDFAKKSDRAKEPWTELRDTIIEEKRESAVLTPEVASFLENAARFRYQLDPELPHGYNHLDIDFHGNVITKDNQIAAIIDFEDLQYSPMIVCLAYSMCGMLIDGGADMMWLYLKEYEKVRPLTPLEREALPNIILFRNYVIGIVELLLLKKKADVPEIQTILKLEKEIPIFWNRK